MKTVFAIIATLCLALPTGMYLGRQASPALSIRVERTPVLFNELQLHCMGQSSGDFRCPEWREPLLRTVPFVPSAAELLPAVPDVQPLSPGDVPTSGLVTM
jgi:hypothetical protein